MSEYVGLFVIMQYGNVNSCFDVTSEYCTHQKNRQPKVSHFGHTSNSVAFKATTEMQGTKVFGNRKVQHTPMLESKKDGRLEGKKDTEGKSIKVWEGIFGITVKGVN